MCHHGPERPFDSSATAKPLKAKKQFSFWSSREFKISFVPKLCWTNWVVFHLCTSGMRLIRAFLPIKQLKNKPSLGLPAKLIFLSGIGKHSAASSVLLAKIIEIKYFSTFDKKVVDALKLFDEKKILLFSNFLLLSQETSIRVYRMKKYCFGFREFDQLFNWSTQPKTYDHWVYQLALSMSLVRKILKNLNTHYSFEPIFKLNDIQTSVLLL